jgi:O-antigen/teichoic acid export membrane protein
LIEPLLLMANNLETTSHKQILKSTGILGGAQVIEILFRIARSKIVAVLLGPTGVGLIGLYQSTIDLVQSATGFGINFIAVRDIAEAAGTNDQKRISRAILILRRWVWLTGLLGLVLTLVFCKPLSRYAFGDDQYAWGIAVLSVVLLLNSVSGGQLALLQGLRRIKMMAQAKIWGVIAGFCITVPLYWLMGVKGIVPAILITAVVSLFLSWFYSRKIPVEPVMVGLTETAKGGIGMIRLGFFMVISGFAMTGAMYYIRAFVSQRSGLDGVGQFQAAWNLSGTYLAAVLQAMGTDYFPRLSAVNRDNVLVNKLVNEQTEVALLVAGPLIVAMLSFMNLVIVVLYSSEFTDTVHILHWQLTGTFLKVISWPIGFIILAKGRGGAFICSELASLIALVTPIVLFWDRFGIEVAGMAFLFMYICYLVIVSGIARWLSGFGWSLNSLKQIMVFGVLVMLAFSVSRYIAGTKGYLAGGFLSMVATGYSFIKLRQIVDLRLIYKKLEAIPKPQF